VTRTTPERQPLLTEGFVHKTVRLEQDGDGEMEILLIESGKRRDGSHGYWLERHIRFAGTDGNPSRERFCRLDEARESLASRIRLFQADGWRLVA
jgi:hypothetical protein